MIPHCAQIELRRHNRLTQTKLTVAPASRATTLSGFPMENWPKTPSVVEKGNLLRGQPSCEGILVILMRAQSPLLRLRGDSIEKGDYGG